MMYGASILTTAHAPAIASLNNFEPELLVLTCPLQPCAKH